MDLVLDSLFYADNTEFLSDPFRTGETTLGAWGRLYLSLRLSDSVELRGGVFGNQRDGSHKDFEHVRPVLALVVGSERSHFVFGSLETARRREGIGPDRTSLHGLLPPIQVETLAFNRPAEAGLQWVVQSARVKSDAWVDWQRLDTAEEREVFDAGLVARLRLMGPVWLGLQLHEYHHGGQLTTVGPVADSFAGAAGVHLELEQVGLDRVSAELYGLRSIDDPDRGEHVRREGQGAFLRVSLEKWGFRLHGIGWRGTDFDKDEGDTNYRSTNESGERFVGTRRYEEAGLTRLFKLTDGVSLEASARLHHIEGKWDYSYRVLGIVGLSWPMVRADPAGN